LDIDSDQNPHIYDFNSNSISAVKDAPRQG